MRDEDTWYVYQRVGGERWSLKDRTMDDTLARNLFSIRCQQSRGASIVLMRGENIAAECNVYQGSLAYPEIP